MSMVGEMTLEDAAKQLAGNWQRFESFCWFRENEIADPDNWAIIYTHNRDSGLLRPEQRRRHRRGDGALHRGRRPGCGDGVP